MDDRLPTGDVDGDDSLSAAIYAQLRRIAERQLSTERPDHTLQATALVHEAYIRLGGQSSSVPHAEFHLAAAQAMRRILIEHARRRGRVKRGGGSRRVMVDLGSVADLGDAEQDEILALDLAIRRLHEVDPRAAEVVCLRFYAGLTIEETSRAMRVSPRTVKRDWEFARAWLYARLAQQAGRSP